MDDPLDYVDAFPDEPVLPVIGEGEDWADIANEQLLLDLVAKHSHRLQRFIIKHIGNTSEAEDIAQQAFVEAARSYQNFRGQSQLSTWLYGIALNLIRNYLSRAPDRRHNFVDESELEQHVSPAQSPDESMMQNQTISLLQESLNELPENMREILLMVGVDEISYEEAAVLLTVPIGTVRSRLSRARSALRAKLEQKGLSLDI